MSKKVISADLADMRKRKAATRKRATEKQLLSRIDALERERIAHETIANARATATIPERESKSTSEATALVLASDWHAEEEIREAEVNFVNKFNLDIAQERSQTFFQRIVRLTDKERQDVKIHDLVLWLGGD